MADDKLIEAIAVRLRKYVTGNGWDDVTAPEQRNWREAAQAALDALKAEGVMLCRWERSLDAKVTAAGFNMAYETLLEGWENHYSLTGLEPPKGE